MKEQTLSCPECRNEDVLVYSETAYKVNTCEYYCENVKIHDDDARAACFACGWVGLRIQLKESN